MAGLSKKPRIATPNVPFTVFSTSLGLPDEMLGVRGAPRTASQQPATSRPLQIATHREKTVHCRMLDGSSGIAACFFQTKDEYSCLKGTSNRHLADCWLLRPSPRLAKFLCEAARDTELSSAMPRGRYASKAMTAAKRASTWPKAGENDGSGTKVLSSELGSVVGFFMHKRGLPALSRLAAT